MSSANQPPNKKKKKSHIEGQGMFSFGNGSEVTFTRLQIDIFFFLIYALFDICPKIISNVLNFLGHLGHLS